MPNFLNLAFFGGGWHKYFWFGVFVKFGIFSNNQFFYIEKMWNLNKNDQNVYFYWGFDSKLWKKSGNRASVACFYMNSCFQGCLIMLHVRVNTKHRNNLKLSMLNVILWIRCSFIVKHIFTVVKTWKWPKMLENFIVGMYQCNVGERDILLLLHI